MKIFSVVIDVSSNSKPVTELKFAELDEILNKGFIVKEFSYSQPFGPNNSSLLITYLLDKKIMAYAT